MPMVGRGKAIAPLDRQEGRHDRVNMALGEAGGSHPPNRQN